MLTTYTNEDRDAKGAVTLCLASFPVRDSNPGLLRANTRERWPAACPSVNSPYGDRTRVSSVKTRYPDHWTKGDPGALPAPLPAAACRAPRGTDRCGIRTHARRLVPETSALDRSAKRPWHGEREREREARPDCAAVDSYHERRDDGGIRTHARRPVP